MGRTSFYAVNTVSSECRASTCEEADGAIPHSASKTSWNIVPGPVLPKGLMLHCGGHLKSREEVFAIPLPEETRSYVPLPWSRWLKTRFW